MSRLASPLSRRIFGALHHVSRSRFASATALLLLLCVAVSAHALPDLSKYGRGAIGMGHNGMATVLGTSGTRQLRNGQTLEVSEGKGLIVRFEGTLLYKESIVGNPGGLSFGAEIGHLGNGIETLKTGKLLASMGLVTNLWFGFPVHVFGMGGAKGGFRLFIEPGVGADLIHLYAYIKPKLSFALPGGALDGEVSWQWSTMEMSSIWGGQFRGAATAIARLAVFLPGEMNLHAFIDLTQSRWEEYAPNTDAVGAARSAYKDVDPLLAPSRDPFLRIWRLGVGKTF